MLILQFTGFQSTLYTILALASTILRYCECSPWNTSIGATLSVSVGVLPMMAKFQPFVPSSLASFLNPYNPFHQARYVDRYNILQKSPYSRRHPGKKGFFYRATIIWNGPKLALGLCKSFVTTSVDLPSPTFKRIFRIILYYPTFDQEFMHLFTRRILISRDCFLCIHLLFRKIPICGNAKMF